MLGEPRRNGRGADRATGGTETVGRGPARGRDQARFGRHGLRSWEQAGEDNISFETDCPHTDTTWPYSDAYIEKLCVGRTDEQAYKVLRGNAIKMLELDRV